jgi:hypothetical protein
MAVYYRDRTVEVNSLGIRVHGHLYRFSELSRIWHRRARPSWGAVVGRGAWGLTLIAPLVAATAALLVALRLDVSPGTRAVIVLAAILVGLGAAVLLDLVLDKMDTSYDRGVHWYEIWAERDGRPFRLLRTRDASHFGRVYRALQRAEEPRSR